MKKILMLFCILMFIAASIYFYITTRTETNTNQTTTPTVFINKHLDSEFITSTKRSVPQECYSKNLPECDSRNYNEVVIKSNTTCKCNVEFDGKKYYEKFTMDIDYKYKELIGMKSFSETDFKNQIFDTYCSFVCDEFAKQIENNTYTETTK